MHKLLDLESTSYKYNDGQTPVVTGLVGKHRPPLHPPLSDDEQDPVGTGHLGYDRPPDNPPLGDDEQAPITGTLEYRQHKKPPSWVIENIINLLGDEQARMLPGFLGYRQYKKPPVKPISDTPFLIAAKMGILEMVEAILKKFPVALYDLDANKKNALLLAIEHRQPRVFDFFIGQEFPDFVLHQVDDGGNSARHLSASFRHENNPWRLPGSALQMHGEVTWFKHVKNSLPSLRFAHYNNEGETPRDIFKRTHETLSKEGTEWLIKTSESCSLVAALIATVAFATSATVPGGVKDDTGLPTLRHHALFTLFSIGSLCALCFSLTALVFFLAIITSRCQVWDFKKNLPRKLLMGLSSLFTSIAAILVSFCAGHFFILTTNLRSAALPIYTVTSVPLTIFAFAQLPLYFDLLRAVVTQEPVRSYKVSYR